ncbi:MAG TPA: glycosyltransferase [Ferruginibacter sp.]|nr:glycosyltransferase [Ferruginibacter sp.]
MPKILRILNRLIIGGPSHNAVLLTKYLEPDYDTVLVVGGKGEDEQDATHLATQLGIQPYTIPEMQRAIDPVKDRIAYKKIKEIIKVYKPDIVHTHAAKSGAIGRLAAQACKVPVVVHTFHGHVFHSYFTPIRSKIFVKTEKYLASRSSGIIAISNLQEQELSSIYKIAPTEKITIIPLGFNLEKFQVNQDQKRKEFRNFYQLQPDEIAIGIVGRLVRIKNHPMFLRVIEKVLSAMPTGVRFFIIGDGDIRKSLTNQLDQYNITHTFYPENPLIAPVTFTSWLFEMDEVYAGLDIVALTSFNEGTPVSIIEAQAAEIPVVSTNVGGVKDIIQENISGFVTCVDDDDNFTKYLLQLINDASLRKEMGKAGRVNVSTRYSFQRLVSDTKNFYDTLLNR